MKNAFSCDLADIASATLFLWLVMSLVALTYRMVITISGPVADTTVYHYLQIMLSWDPCVHSLSVLNEYPCPLRQH
jgi:hypothetical protein